MLEQYRTQNTNVQSQHMYRYGNNSRLQHCFCKSIVLLSILLKSQKKNKSWEQARLEKLQSILPYVQHVSENCCYTQLKNRKTLLVCVRFYSLRPPVIQDNLAILGQIKIEQKTHVINVIPIKQWRRNKKGKYPAKSKEELKYSFNTCSILLEYLIFWYKF